MQGINSHLFLFLLFLLIYLLCQFSKLNNLIIPHDILENEYGAGYRSLTKEEIREQIHFQEQYFDSEIVM